MIEKETILKLGQRIVILHRGWVLMGTVRIDGDFAIINDCACIRKWGTKKGLGEIALKGPTGDTILDPQPETVVPLISVIQMIEVENVASK